MNDSPFTSQHRESFRAPSKFMISLAIRVLMPTYSPQRLATTSKTDRIRLVSPIALLSREWGGSADKARDGGGQAKQLLQTVVLAMPNFSRNWSYSSDVLAPRSHHQRTLAWSHLQRRRNRAGSCAQVRT